jgi:hypothetical protein
MRFLIRFNTKNNGHEKFWRVRMENGQEILTDEVVILVPSQTVMAPVNGEIKFHIEVVATDMLVAENSITLS